MSQNLLEAKEFYLIKKILSVRRHYDFLDLQGNRLGEADGNLVQIPAKFSVFDRNGTEVLQITGKAFSNDGTYTFYDSSGEQIGSIRAIFQKEGSQFLVEKDGLQLMRIHRQLSSKPTLQSLVSLSTPDELLDPLLNYVVEVDDKTVAKFHRKWPALRHQISLSITEEVDHRLVIGSVIVVEHVDVEGK
jgi:uncharacterized protein YxjI